MPIHYLSYLKEYAPELGTLAGVAITLWYTERKDNRQYQRERKKAKKDKLEALYVDTLSSLEQAMRNTLNSVPSEQLDIMLATLNARLLISAPDSVIKQHYKVGTLITEWSGEYAAAQPKRSSSGLTTYIAGNTHMESADKLYPQIEIELKELKDVMIVDLKANEK